MHNDSRMPNIKPEPTERAKKIFQEACYTENMEAKFGRTLTKEDNVVRKFILSQTPTLGRIPSTVEISEEFSHFNKGKLEEILNELDRFDAIHLDESKTNIIAAYPFSGSATSYKVSYKRKEYKSIFAMCAIDALGISFMFDSDVSIESLCFHCEQKIEIDVQDEEIISLNPKETVVWCDMEYSKCAATSLCRNINFFSSEEHFKKWQKGKVKSRGHLLRLDEAFYLGKLFFKERIN